MRCDWAAGKPASERGRQQMKTSLPFAIVAADSQKIRLTDGRRQQGPPSTLTYVVPGRREVGLHKQPWSRIAVILEGHLSILPCEKDGTIDANEEADDPAHGRVPAWAPCTCVRLLWLRCNRLGRRRRERRLLGSGPRISPLTRSSGLKQSRYASEYGCRLSDASSRRGGPPGRRRVVRRTRPLGARRSNDA